MYLTKKETLPFGDVSFEGCPVGLGRFWWFLIIPYMSIIY